MKDLAYPLQAPWPPDTAQFTRHAPEALSLDSPGWDFLLLPNSAQIANVREVNSVDSLSLVPNSCLGY